MLHKNAYTKEFPGIDDPKERPLFDKLWLKSFVSVVTRCFGWGLPRTSMIPFADTINHHNVDSTYELIHEKYHLAATESEGHPEKGPKNYYTKSKMEMDFSDFLPDYSADIDEDPTADTQEDKPVE